MIFNTLIKNCKGYLALIFDDLQRTLQLCQDLSPYTLQHQHENSLYWSLYISYGTDYDSLAKNKSFFSFLLFL